MVEGKMERLYDRYRPYQGNKNYVVWVKLISDYKDINEAEGTKERILTFEVFTYPMIDYYYSHYVEHKVRNFSPVVYRFSSSIPDTYPGEALAPFLESKEENKYINCLMTRECLADGMNDSQLYGTYLFSCSHRYAEVPEDILPRSYEAAMWLMHEIVDYDSAAKKKLDKVLDAIDRSNKAKCEEGKHHEYEAAAQAVVNEVEKTKIKIYNVGSANSIFIEQQDKTILFDCGLDLSAKKKEDNKKKHAYKAALAEIISLTPDFIVISHWHLDHYNLLKEFLLSGKEPFLVFSGFNHCDDQVKALVENWPFNKKHDFDGQAIDKHYFDQWGFNNICLFRGENKVPDPQNPIIHNGFQWNPGEIKVKNGNTVNDESLMMTIGVANDYQRKRMILPGDTSYLSWPKDDELSMESVSDLLVPHHCGWIYTFPVKKSNRSDTTVFVTTKRAAVNDIDIDEPDKKVHTKNLSFLQWSMNKKLSDLRLTSQIAIGSTPYYEVEID